MVIYELNRLEVGNAWTQSDRNWDSLICYVLGIYYVLLLVLLLGFSIFSLYTHPDTRALLPLCPTLCKKTKQNKTLNSALKLDLGLLLCVAKDDAGNPVKPIMIIIIAEAPWCLEDAVYHNPPSIFPAGPFPLQASYNPVAMDLQSCSQ